MLLYFIVYWNVIYLLVTCLYTLCFWRFLNTIINIINYYTIKYLYLKMKKILKQLRKIEEFSKRSTANYSQILTFPYNYIFLLSCKLSPPSAFHLRGTITQHFTSIFHFRLSYFNLAPTSRKMYISVSPKE